ncbi:MAG: hypothetical protein ABEI86_03645, partial [Halobacteriaceae archaeon]
VPGLPQQYRTSVYNRAPIAQDLLTTISEIAKSSPGANITISERSVCMAFRSYAESNEPKPISDVPQKLTVEAGQVYAEFPDGSGRIFLQMGDTRSTITDLLETGVAARYRNYA